MKKLFAILLILALALSGMAQASGLPQIGGGLPQIKTEPAGEAGVVPDPAELLGTEGETFAEDYAYAADYVCTVYLYEQPGDLQTFFYEYQSLAEANGFTAENVQVDGYGALKLSYDGKYALLFPEYDGMVMLMVQNGMLFGEPLPEGNYIRFVRNGRTITTEDPYYLEMEKGTGLFGVGGTYEIEYYFTEQPISFFMLAFPDYAMEGDVFHVDKRNLQKGLCFYTTEEEYMVFYEDDYGNKLETSSDYFTLEITKMVKTDTLVQVEGTFEGAFDGGKSVYEDGSFRMEMSR